MANTDPNSRRSLLARWLAVQSTVAPEGPAAHENVEFERTDIGARGVILAGALLLVAVWIIVLLLHFVFAFFANDRAEASPRPSPLAATQNLQPPAPQLQVSPHEDLKDLRTYEDWKLKHYSWVDRQNGVVEIPIERAMEMIAATGIPAQKTPPDLKLMPPTAGTRRTGFEGKVEPEPQ